MPFLRPIAFAIVALMLVPTGLGFHDPSPAAHSGAVEGSSWAIVTFEFAGGRLGAEIMVDAGSGDEFGIGFVVIQRGAITNFFTTHVSMAHPSVDVSTRLTPEVGVRETVVVDRTEARSLGAAVDKFSAPAGTYHLVGWASGDTAGLRWALRGTGITITSVTTGDRTFLATHRDFEGPLGVDVDVSRAAARASLLVEHEVTVQDGLVGTFGRAAEDVMYADTPTGRKACTCEFRGTPPGQYRMHVHGVGSTHVFGYSFAFNGADLVLPTS